MDINCVLRNYTMEVQADRQKHIQADGHKDRRRHSYYFPYGSQEWKYGKKCPLIVDVTLSFCLSVFLSFCLSVFLSLCLSVSLSLCLSVFLSLCLSVSLFLCLSKYGKKCPLIVDVSLCSPHASGRLFYSNKNDDKCVGPIFIHVETIMCPITIGNFHIHKYMFGL